MDQIGDRIGEPAPPPSARPAVRRVPLARGSFLAAWASDPGRFADVLPDPFAPGAMEDAARRVAAGNAARASRDRVASLLARDAERFGAGPESFAAVERLRDPGSVAVVTGQQAGLFGGPLYSLAKAVSTVLAAREIEARTGRPAVPVFWIEADDHDFEEVRTAWTLDRDGAPAALRYEPGAVPDGPGEQPGVPIFRRVLDDAATALVERLSEVLPPTSFTAEAVATIADAWAPGRTFAEAFGRFLARTTRDVGLAIMDPTTPEMKELAEPAFRAGLAHREAGRRNIREACARIEAEGLSPQAAPEGYGLFRVNPDGVRIRHRPEDDGIGAPAAGLSAAVLLRPLVQDHLLPTAAYVGGAAEVAYHAEIGGLYELHGLPRPLVLPRHQLFVLSRQHMRVIEDDGVTLDELAAGDEGGLNRAAADPRTGRAFAELGARFGDGMDEVEEASGALDPTLRGAAQRARGKIASILSDLERKAVRAAKRKDVERRTRFERARSALFPNGTPQERLLGPVTFLNRHGADFARILMEGLGRPEASRVHRNLIQA